MAVRVLLVLAAFVVLYGCAQESAPDAKRRGLPSSRLLLEYLEHALPAAVLLKDALPPPVVRERVRARMDQVEQDGLPRCHLLVPARLRRIAQVSGVIVRARYQEKAAEVVL